MGNYLSSPIEQKASHSGGDDRLLYACSEMQGWRIAMEDEHIAIVNLGEDQVDKNAFFAVYDGHGGKAMATFAQQNVHKRLVKDEAYHRKDYELALKKAFLGTDEDFLADKSNTRESGCTAIAALITYDGKIYLANAGDSRSVLSVQGEAKPLSFDHKPDNTVERARILKAGGYIERGRVCGFGPSRALGDFKLKINTSLKPEEQIMTADPEVTIHEITSDDEFLVLACDGIWDCLDSQEVVDIVRLKVSEGKELVEICELICDHCLGPNSDSRGCDNMSILIVAILNGRTKEDWYGWVADRVRQGYGYQTPPAMPRIYPQHMIDAYRNKRKAMEAQERKKAAEKAGHVQTSDGLLIDVHTHVYLPCYASLLRTRTSVPRIQSSSALEGEPEERLLLFNDEPAEQGQPLGAQYWDMDEKLRFMDTHKIHISLVSPANPWLDFLPASEAHPLALELNEDLEKYCASSPRFRKTRVSRLYGYGLLPLVPDVQISSVLEVVQQISRLPHLKGVIMGTRGIGRGLGDEALDPVWAAIESAGLVVFLHPHYGVDPNVWEDNQNGQALPLALGFPFETTIAVTRLILSGALDRFPSLKILLAHSGGAFPLLSSRLASCIDHDPKLGGRLAHDSRYYLGRFYFDAVAYGPEELEFVDAVISRSERYKSGSSISETPERNSRGSKLLFGTDHPFSPTNKGTGTWKKSAEDDCNAIGELEGWSEEEKNAVRGGNAIDLFDLNASNK